MDAFSKREGQDFEKLGDFKISNGRIFPPLGLNDTVCMVNGAMFGEHESLTPFIPDDKIFSQNITYKDWYPVLTEGGSELSIGNREAGNFIIKADNLEIPVFVYENSLGKLMHLIPQMAQRSCVWTCISMQILDSCAELEIENIDVGRVFQNIYKGSLSGLRAAKDLLEVMFKDKAEIFYSEDLSFSSFTSRLERGVASLSVDDLEIGGHAVCAHSFNRKDRTVRIKDPFHGWDITTSIQELFVRRRLSVKPFLQITKL